MYKNNLKQMEFEQFSLPFGGKLRSDNRWVKLAKLIPWDEFEILYETSLAGTGMGAPAFSVRIALGALIIKERLGTTDEETVEQIKENPYLQYFLGFKAFKEEAPFHPTMFVHFRKRFGKTTLKEINEIVALKAMGNLEPKEKDKDTSSKSDDDNNPTGKSANKGKLLIDATCSPADISFPTDLKILNQAREISEKIIDILHEPHKGKHKKPRTYRKTARKKYLIAAKRPKLNKKQIRQAIKKQLSFVGRNLNSIDQLAAKTSLLLLDHRQYKNLLVINEVYRQQKWMFDNRIKRIDDRIVSISQPHVRPIKRGKAGADTEFGAKISVSMVDGFAFVDRISWNNFNEGSDLKDQVKAYKKRFGFWPESIHVDKIYRNRDNRKFCKKHDIRISGPALGRPPQITAESSEAIKANKIQTRSDEVDRIAIEGKFGQAKRRFGLGRIKCKLAQTSEASIGLIFLVMNLEKWLKAILFCAIFQLKNIKIFGAEFFCQIEDCHNNFEIHLA